MQKKSPELINAFSFLHNYGESAMLIQSIDWNNSILGNVKNWPKSLKLTLSIILNATAPMVLFWGPRHIFFYNDAFSKSVEKSKKCSEVMGQKGEDRWPEVWNLIEPKLQIVLQGGSVDFNNDQYFPFLKRLNQADSNWTLSFGAVDDDFGEIAGVFISCYETINKIKNLIIGYDTGVKVEFTENEQRFKQLIEQAPVAICVLTGSDFNICIANILMLQLWGKTSQEVLNLPFLKVVPELIHDNFENRLLNIIKTGIGYKVKEVALNFFRNGKNNVVYINFVYEAIKDKNGQIEGLIAVATDVTEQVSARNIIRDVEQRIDLALDAVNLGTFDYNIVTGEIFNSPRGMAIFGFDKQVSRDESVMALHPDDRDHRLKAYQNALKNGFLSYQARVIWKDESIHWVRIEGKVFFNEAKEPIRLLGTIQDITKQQNAEEDLVKINQRLQIALESEKLGHYELDLITGNIEASEQFCLNLGLNKTGSLIIADISDMIVPSFREMVNDKMHEAILNNTVCNIEYQITWPDNSIHWIKTSAKAIYNELNIPQLLIGVVSDVSDKKQLQKQKDDFVGMVCHELKTPITSIKAYNQLIEESLLQKGDKKEAKMAGKMQIQVNRLSNLIEDLQESTINNSGKLTYSYSSFNFDELVNNIVEDVKNTTTIHVIETQFSVCGEIKSDKNRLVQVISNLITNAIKFSSQNPRIIVVTKIKDNELLLSVQDFGIGISKDNQTKIFEQFYRVANEDKKKVEGLGLGLYISTEIINKLGGRLWVESEAGKGSTFYISLPINK